MASPSNALPRGVTPIPSTDGFHEIELLPSQDDELFGCDPYYLTTVIGGPGSGKTIVNAMWVERWGGICTEQPYAIFANTWDQMVNAILGGEGSGLYEQFAALGRFEGRDYVMGKKVPKRWRKEWRRRGIRVPIERASGVKMLVLRWSGVHIYLGTYANQSWRRMKGQSLQAVIGEEITEPDVNVRDFLTYLLTRVRCGRGAKCAERGHFHRIILKGNVPLHNPRHGIYKLVDDLKAQELERRNTGEPPFFRLLEVDTRENFHLSSQYVPALAAGMDADTFEEQVSGKLTRRAHSLSYYSFSEDNILPRADWPHGLTYGNTRELHMWFDFNKTPATSGWGHDLRLDEVPESDRGAKHHFGVIGELFSDNDPMDTFQVANALLEDPDEDVLFAEAHCMSCRDNPREPCTAQMKDHMSVPGRGKLCRKCAYKTPDGKRFCSGKVVNYTGSRRHIHAPQNWHGLLKHRGKIFIYGDASGNAEHADSVRGSSHKILRSVFAVLGSRVTFRFKPANPGIMERVLGVNGGLRARNGDHSLFIAPWCEAHLEDFRQVYPDPKTGHPMKVYATEKERAKGNGYWQRTHSTDGLGYMWDYRWPFIIPKPGEMPYAGEGSDYGPLAHHWREP